MPAEARTARDNNIDGEYNNELRHSSIMLPSIDDSIIEDTVGAELDSEIASLKLQISSLRAQRKIQASTILSSRTTSHILSRLRSHKHASAQPSPTTNEDVLLSTATAQKAHNVANTYRLAASITTFTIQDPDPNAVDGGHVLALRIDVSSAGKYVRPYYVMLNKPFKEEQKDLLRVHRHTLPPGIPLEGLVRKWLPNGKSALPMSSKAVAGAKRQDLARFGRALRREVVGYHNRLGVVKGLRKEFALDEKPNKKGKGREKVILDISAADAEAKQVRIEWIDGKIGRAVVDEKGEVKKCVIIGEDGRDRETERRVTRGRMEGIGERLREGIY